MPTEAERTTSSTEKVTTPSGQKVNTEREQDRLESDLEEGKESTNLPGDNESEQSNK